MSNKTGLPNNESPEKKELKSQWKNETEGTVLKEKDVAQHKTKQDMWITIHGKGNDDTTTYTKHSLIAE